MGRLGDWRGDCDMATEGRPRVYTGRAGGTGTLPADTPLTARSPLLYLHAPYGYYPTCTLPLRLADATISSPVRVITD